MRRKTYFITRILILMAFILPGLLLAPPSFTSPSLAQSSSNIYLPMVLTIDRANNAQGARINAPHFDGGISRAQSAIAWFGHVTPTYNYADIRVGYNDEQILIQLEVFDRRLWYDTTPSPAEMTNWDAATLYINTTGNQAVKLDENSYKLTAQLNWWEDRENFQAFFRGSPLGWQPITLQFEAATGWRGDAPNNDSDDRGWVVSYYIPFSELGLLTSPDEGSIWGVAIELHDRDDQQGTPISTQTWPPQFDANKPDSWNQIHFGLPVFLPPQATNLETITIRHNLNGVVVEDAHVGGHTVCGQDYWPDFFDGWGDANYAGYDQINIQNQADVADWPCFSKFYITFPLDQIPAGKVIVSAELLMDQFGNSGQGWEPPPQPSLIQVLTVSADWDESSITWNNGPLATENISQTIVDPLPVGPSAVERRWDLSRGVFQAYASGQPLQLTLYAADTEIHSGKYFYSSDVDDYMPEARPTLLITFGDP